MKTRRMIAAAALLGTLAFVDLGIAQDNAASPSDRSPSDRSDGESIDRIKLFNELQAPSVIADRESSVSEKESIARLRQARALQRASNRAARMERNLWYGYNPLRPNWNAVPMTQSRYASPTLYVPIYVYHR